MSSLDKRDYTLIIDKSGSMGTTDMPGGRSRWDAMQEATVAVARRCEQFDPDGITVYLFASRFKRYDNVTSAKVAKSFARTSRWAAPRLMPSYKMPSIIFFSARPAGN
jgi:hypothetical protein